MQVFSTYPKWFREDFEAEEEANQITEVTDKPEPLVPNLEEELKRKRLSKLIKKAKLIN